MEAVNVTELRKRFADVVSRVAYGKERVTIAKHGRRVAVIMPVEDADYLERLEDERDAHEAGARLAEFHRSGGKALSVGEVDRRAAARDRARKR